MKETKVERRKIEEINQLQVIIHMYMEMLQGNSLCNHLKQTKMSFFFSFLFFFLQNQRTEGLNRSYQVGDDTSGREGEMGKVCWRMNIVQILCTHVHKWKNDTY
jgi:hypothetical protein